MALHKPDVSLGKESRKINKSVWIPLSPQTWVPHQIFLRALHALGLLVPLSSTEGIHVSPPKLPTAQLVSISNVPMSLRGIQGSFFLQKNHSFAGAHRHVRSPQLPII